MHSSNAAMAFTAKATVSLHATLSPRALQPPTASICARAARTLTSAACGEPLSEITAAMLNELPDGVSTQFGQTELACVRTVNNVVTSVAAHQRPRRDSWRKSLITAASTKKSEPAKPAKMHKVQGGKRTENSRCALSLLTWPEMVQGTGSSAACAQSNGMVGFSSCDADRIDRLPYNGPFPLPCLIKRPLSSIYFLSEEPPEGGVFKGSIPSVNGRSPDNRPALSSGPRGLSLLISCSHLRHPCL